MTRDRGRDRKREGGGVLLMPTIRRGKNSILGGCVAAVAEDRSKTPPLTTLVVRN